MKRHNITIERWSDGPGPLGQRGACGFRWTVSYEKDGRRRVQGFEETHAAARAAAEACLVENGIDLDWIPRETSATTLLTPRSKRLSA
ncbi:MAG: hypothetical protein AAF530_17080 [Pseudomonadota bacterium]